VALHRALIDRAPDGLPIPLGKRRGQCDLDPNASHELALGIPPGRHRQGQSGRVEVALLAEAEHVEAGARADRREKEIEGRRSRAATALSDRLIGPDPEAFVQRVDLPAAGKFDLHGPNVRSPPAARLMQAHHRTGLALSTPPGGARPGDEPTVVAAKMHGRGDAPWDPATAGARSKTPFDARQRVFI
jgi:hypothetical protein